MECEDATEIQYINSLFSPRGYFLSYNFKYINRSGHYRSSNTIRWVKNTDAWPPFSLYFHFLTIVWPGWWCSGRGWCPRWLAGVALDAGARGVASVGGAGLGTDGADHNPGDPGHTIQTQRRLQIFSVTQILQIPGLCSSWIFNKKRYLSDSTWSGRGLLIFSPSVRMTAGLIRLVTMFSPREARSGLVSGSQ